ncbi:MAG: BatD family protein, partial [Planctomycetota bacterium]
KALLYTIRLSGKGNISSAKLPTIKSVPGFRVFAPTVRDDIQTNASGISGFKEAEYLMMPQKGGRIRIPAVKLPIFDPVAGRYKTLKTKSLRVFVDGKPDPSATIEPPPPKDEKEVPTVAALRPLRFKSSLSSAGAPPWQNSWFWLLLFAPGLGSGATAAWTWSKQQRSQVTPRTAQKAAVQQAQDNLDKARADINSGALADAHAKIADALRTCGSQTLGISLQGLTFDAVSTATKARGLSDEDANDLVRLLEAADYARYAPSQLNASATQSDIQRAEQLIASFESLAGDAP